MEKIHLTTFINAPREKVWDVMLSDASYRDWTSAFNPGSYYEGSWEEGSEIRFLGPDMAGEGAGGLVSRIAEIRPNEFVSIEHLGVIKNGVEDRSPEAMNGWAGALENYTFTEKDGGTELVIDQDMSAEERPTMEAMWQNGLARIKELSEA
jgi:uncharacterized protein YndB with AHSA1/START domain